MARTLTKGSMRWLLRGLLLIGRSPIASKAGFVLPTTVLLLLVVTLTVGAISYRTYTRSVQAIGERQQRVVYNAATPTIDRAKAKLEFMFSPNRDRRSGGVPSEDQLIGMMLNDGSNGVPRYPQALPGEPDPPDPYTFDGETRIDINRDGALDNAWMYNADLNSDGELDSRIVYSIVFDAPDPNLTTQRDLNLRDSTETTVRSRANSLLIRNSPLSNATATNSACVRDDGEGGVPQVNGQGWFEDPTDSTRLRKNFQVDAYVLPIQADGTVDPNSTVATLEFQQDREANQGFKWAAWFRNDLEIFPGPEFNWNGAMHTEGSMFVAGNFRGFMVSSPSSCLYKEDASRITSPDIADSPDVTIPNFQGQFIAGSLRDNNFNGNARFDIWAGEGQTPTPAVELKSDTDSVTNPSEGPIAFALDPVALQTSDVSRGRIVNDPRANREETATRKWSQRNLSQRMVNLGLATPYVDDTFRADNRYGPKPRFGQARKPIPGAIGDEISGELELIGNDPAPGQDDLSVGLDGYWERRARREGLRLIVGQRLELGDPAGWGGPTTETVGSRQLAASLAAEPLSPWNGACNQNSVNQSRCNEQRQRRSLWDNLAAVQATAIYHADSPSGKDFPAACLATTVHPGTAGTLDKSATFESLIYGFGSSISGYSGAEVISDFLRGRGTNGWEFAVPSEDDFKTSASPLRQALSNLANFAGDPYGGAPSFRPEFDGEVHPYPAMAMWGDYSMLRRVLQKLDSGVDYGSLSPADKTVLHTAGCTLGMLAYNIDYLQKFDLNSVPADVLGVLDAPYTSNSATKADDPYWQGLRGHLRAIDALINDERALSDERGQDEAGNSITTPSAFRSGDSKIPDDIRRLTKFDLNTMARSQDLSNDPEVYIRLLEFWRDGMKASAKQFSADTVNLRERLTREIYLAQMILAKEQVARDRQFGFLGAYPDSNSNTFNYSIDKYAGQNEAGRIDARSYGACYTSIKGDASASPAVAAKTPAQEPLQRLCSARPRYPILYSLFPLYDHGDVRNSGYSTADREFIAPRVRDQEILDRIRYLRSANENITYSVVNPAQVATRPLRLGGLGGTSDWTLPATPETSGSTPNSNQYELIKVCETTTPCSIAPPEKRSTSDPRVSGPRYRVAFKDSAFFNGREQMTVRALNLDLDLMRTSTAFTSNYWLPKSGIIYAFREDALSEAHIVRPTSDLADWSSCSTDTALRTVVNCQMNTAQVSAYESTDPPVDPANLITPKPVDYFPDPDRRPHGFRLRNGAAIWRGSLSGSTIDDTAGGRGLSFVTHNPAYVQGAFNLHRAPSTTSLARSSALEEFETPLDLEDFENFYTRSDLNSTFASLANDQWRPSEIVADSVTPLSTVFCDGSIEDGFLTAARGLNNNAEGVPDENNPSLGSVDSNFVRDRYGCTKISQTSYLNQNRAVSNVSGVNGIKWIRANLAESLWRASLPSDSLGSSPSGSAASPIYISRQGDPLIMNTSKQSEIYDGAYQKMNLSKPLITTDQGLQMNMIMVSGIVPSRVGQSYGGLHNFPRFLENWDKDFYISGAFLQLNFSTYATAPFDQEEWEPGQDAPVAGSGGNEWIRYYSPPDRRWGYDVGLKYQPPGPVAQRFTSPDPTRSEFYSEPPANDPYIQNLAVCANDPASCSADDIT